MAAFRLAVENGYGMELDIHLLADGNLAVIHDASLKRTAGADVMIEDLTTEQLTEFHLEGTDQTIPTFRQVLDLVDGKVPLIIELKDKLNIEDVLERGTSEIPTVVTSAQANGAQAEAIQALVALGYSNTEAVKAVKKVQMDDTTSVEDILKSALKFMMF